MGCWRGYLSGARCRLAYGPADATDTHCLLLQENPDWFYLSGTHRLTRVVPDKGPLNGCVCVVGDNWLTTSGVVAGKRGRATHALVNISEGQSVAATTDTTWVLSDNECVPLSLSFTIVS